MLLITAAPIEPPIVRTLAFMPLATPVCSGGTATTTSVDIDAKERPKPTPMIDHGDEDLPLRGVGEGEQGVGEDADQRDR